MSSFTSMSLEKLRFEYQARRDDLQDLNRELERVREEIQENKEFMASGQMEGRPMWAHNQVSEGHDRCERKEQEILSRMRVLQRELSELKALLSSKL